MNPPRPRPTSRLPLILSLVLTAPSSLVAAADTPAAGGEQPWLVFEGRQGPGKAKHVVLISGDEEYRSEEALPALAKILARHHGFKCTVLFAIDPRTGQINPKMTNNIPGIEALKTADLMVIATRFRDLPDGQMKHVDDYLASGKPVIGLRTATHAFNIPKGKTYEKYSYNYKGDAYKDGFGRQVLGETWVNHHGAHGKESTRGVIAEGAKDHPVVRGVDDVWGPTDVYGVRNLPEGSTPVLMGKVINGMKPQDPPVEGKKNDPMMPVAWVRTYKSGDKEGRVFTTTMGSSTDLSSEGLRRLLVNAVYWAAGMEDKIPEKANVDLVGEFKPTPFGFDKYQQGKKPADYAQGAEELLQGAKGK
jgi:type 1 glutamine amidotransferase